jgi:C4-dicarboxylate-specific signal transduction histidine kinase
MRFTIATKLFIGFLCVIGLNAAFFVIVKKIDITNAIVDILARENEVKNRLLRLKTLHRVQGPSVISYEKIGLQESVENFRGIHRNLVGLIDTINRQLDSIRDIDSQQLSQERNARNQVAASKTVELMGAISFNNKRYSTSFEDLVKRRSIPLQAGIPAAGEKALTDTLDTLERVISNKLDSAESIIREQTNVRIRDIGGDVNNVKNATMAILGCVTIFSLFFGLIFSRTITNSLRRLKESAALIGKSDFDIDPLGFPNDETGDLAKAFFNMAVDLRSKQEDLIKSKRLAAIGEVVASVNHEINNPLMIISGNAQFLEMSMNGYPDEMKERVQAILEETRRISQITRKLREIKNPVSEDYTVNGTQMINLKKSLE